VQGGRRQPGREPDTSGTGGAEGDRIGALVRDPGSVYVYWRLEGAHSGEVARELGPGCEWILRVLDLTEGTSTSVPVRREAGSHYLEVRPGHSYGFEIAATAGGRWRTVCRTERVEIPPALQAGGTGKPTPAVERLRPDPAGRDVPGLRYETTVPYLATSPGPPSDEES